MKIITIIGFIFLNSYFGNTAFMQIPEKNRYPKQYYFEDSTRVFWTWYPNPFSPPTITDKSKGRLICGDLSFYCDLSDTIIVALVQNADSIVYSAPIISSIPSYFSLCYWMAGPNINLEELPDKFFQSNTNEALKLMLIVNDRKKCIRNGDFRLQKNWYWWINESKTKKQ